MASKNLGAVIQRAISDGAFRRQLQSDPAAALRGFNLTPDEVAAIRSADSSKLMSLGVDQRMSKAFSVSGMLGATRATTSDLSSGGSANSLVADATVGTREGMADPTISGTRAIHEDAPADLRTAATIGDLSGVRAIHDVAPFGTPGTSAVEDPNAPEFGAARSIGDVSGVRPVHDSEPFAGNAAINDNLAAASAGRGSSLAGDMPDTRAVHDVAPFEGNATAADDGGTLASRMADAGSADGVRAIHDVAPFEGDASAAAPSGSEMIGSDSHLEPGPDHAHTGDALGSTGPDTGDEHSWG